MMLSRTTRFVILLFLLAAATFVWVNYLLEGTDTPDPITEGAQPMMAMLQVEVQPDATDTATPSEGTETVTGDAPVVIAVEPAVTPEVPTVTAQGMQTIAERELEVAQFPFLVTEPPVITTAAVGNDGDAVLRPQARRASINPFSPVLAVAPVAPATPVAGVAPPATQPNIEVVAVEVSVPGAPTLPGVQREPVVETVVAPTPRPLAPPSPLAQGLPRQLPSGTLPITPDILQTTRVPPPVVEIEPVVEIDPEVESVVVEPEVVRPQPQVIAAAAMIREPNDTVLADLEAVGTTPNSGAAVPGLLGLAVVEAEPEPVAVVTPVATVPLAAGTDLLSRYLRDNSFSFTGTVRSSISVGVFTSPLHTTPVVVSLGQTLPDTDIVLTDLRGQQAEFTLGDMTQVLTLNLGR